MAGLPCDRLINRPIMKRHAEANYLKDLLNNDSTSYAYVLTKFRGKNELMRQKPHVGYTEGREGQGVAALTICEY